MHRADEYLAMLRDDLRQAAQSSPKAAFWACLNGEPVNAYLRVAFEAGYRPRTGAVCRYPVGTCQIKAWEAGSQAWRIDHGLEPTWLPAA